MRAADVRLRVGGKALCCGRLNRDGETHACSLIRGGGMHRPARRAYTPQKRSPSIAPLQNSGFAHLKPRDSRSSEALIFVLRQMFESELRHRLPSVSLSHSATIDR